LFNSLFVISVFSCLSRQFCLFVAMFRVVICDSSQTATNRDEAEQ
jgi:hypothetical protein